MNRCCDPGGALRGVGWVLCGGPGQGPCSIAVHGSSLPRPPHQALAAGGVLPLCMIVCVVVCCLGASLMGSVHQLLRWAGPAAAASAGHARCCDVPLRQVDVRGGLHHSQIWESPAGAVGHDLVTSRCFGCSACSMPFARGGQLGQCITYTSSHSSASVVKHRTQLTACWPLTDLTLFGARLAAAADTTSHVPA